MSFKSNNKGQSPLSTLNSNQSKNKQIIDSSFTTPKQSKTQQQEDNIDNNNNNNNRQSTTPSNTNNNNNNASSSTTNNVSKEAFYPPQFPSFESFSQTLLTKVVETTKLGNEIGELDMPYLLSTNANFKRQMKQFGTRIVDLIQKFMDKESADANSLRSFQLSEVIDHFDSVVDVCDNIFERVDVYVDEEKGELKGPKITVANANLPSFSPEGRKFTAMIADQIPRPQLLFDTGDIENENAPFVPKLKTKTNSLVPWNLSSVIVNKEDENWSYPHPYEFEINHLKAPLNPQSRPETLYKALDQTKLTWVDNEESLKQMAATLDSQTEIAIDLENHAYRTFQGFVCLMQISTRNEDFVIDTLKLRSKMHILNSSFTNPKIVKILHGANSDIPWLQRDFGLYIVNLFDTGQASKLLEFPRFSLAYLLEHYCGLHVDKQYQLADWRIRPLPSDMLKYAREDTHYLLYVYDRIWNELLSRGNETNNLVQALFERSREVSLLKYEKDRLFETSHLGVYNKYNLVFTPQQMGVFAALFAWRDMTARREDESIRFILPNHMLFHIAQSLPTDVQSLLACCSPVPPAVKTEAQELVLMITNILKEVKNNIPQTVTPNTLAKRVGPNVPVFDEQQHQQTSLLNKAPKELFRAAGWVQEKERQTMFQILLNSDNKDLIASKAGRLADMFDSASSGDEEDDSKIKAKAVHESLARHTQELGIFSHTPVGTHAEKHTHGEIHKQLQQTQPTLNVPTTTIQHGKQTQTQTQQQQPQQQQPQTPKQTTTTTTNPKDSPIQSPVIPQSISEIYKLSQKVKRKRGHEKKQGNAGDKDGSSDDDEEQRGDSVKKQKQSKPTSEMETDTQQFMDEIGWTDDQEKDSRTNTTSNSNSTITSESAAAAKPFVPYDYASNASKFLPPQPVKMQSNQQQQNQSFQPQFTSPNSRAPNKKNNRAQQSQQKSSTLTGSYGKGGGGGGWTKKQ